ncbi:uncharacterized protein N0V89_011224 [Didymosphaeria variabile]|uniref:Uncharacterized protein n=1 Tax=Didymosphaeria variabile TaxID=1932322 RepID=A0A9W9C6X7_9PLEO|nr:uncharacterized protein N0V89_011224 [Didymosphaeria variabile]KAJ4347284.1 hypothetical protein N0V89_011224 [Didymosphaeria variabile]
MEPIDRLLILLRIVYYLLQVSVFAKVSNDHKDTSVIFPCICIVISASFGNHLPAFFMGVFLSIFLIVRYHLFTPRTPDSSDPPAKGSGPESGPAGEDPGSNIVGFPNGFSVPDDSDDEDDFVDPLITSLTWERDEETLNTRIDTLTAMNEDLTADNEALAKQVYEWKEAYYSLEINSKAEYNIVKGQNVELNRRINIYEAGRPLQFQTNRLNKANAVIMEKEQEIDRLTNQVKRLEDAAQFRHKCYEENSKLKAELDEKNILRASAHQATEEKASALNTVVTLLHSMVEKGGLSLDPAVFIMYELLRSGINPQHLQVDLDKYIWYLRYVRLGYSQRGTIHGGFRATIAMFFGGEYRGNVFTKEMNGAEVVLPLTPTSRLDLEQVGYEPEFPPATPINGATLPGPSVPPFPSNPRQPPSNTGLQPPSNPRQPPSNPSQPPPNAVGPVLQGPPQNTQPFPDPATDGLARELGGMTIKSTDKVQPPLQDATNNFFGKRNGGSQTTEGISIKGAAAAAAKPNPFQRAAEAMKAKAAAGPSGVGSPGFGSSGFGSSGSVSSGFGSPGWGSSATGSSGFGSSTPGSSVLGSSGSNSQPATAPSANLPDDPLKAALDLVAAKKADPNDVAKMLKIPLSMADRYIIGRVRTRLEDVSTAYQKLIHLVPSPQTKANPGAPTTSGVKLGPTWSVPTTLPTAAPSSVPFPGLKPQPKSGGDAQMDMFPDSSLNGGAKDFKPGQSFVMGGALPTAAQSSSAPAQSKKQTYRSRNDYRSRDDDDDDLYGL